MNPSVPHTCYTLSLLHSTDAVEVKAVGLLQLRVERREVGAVELGDRPRLRDLGRVEARIERLEHHGQHIVEASELAHIGVGQYERAVAPCGR